VHRAAPRQINGIIGQIRAQSVEGCQQINPHDLFDHAKLGISAIVENVFHHAEIAAVI